ncbi:MAG: pyridoxamine 5'-phosphate oxidase family protein [Planctomycetes bacterium]|nr:pyridoxamine 5'-phosphate oxidase family protein [Planctomycetota bacterium]
MGLNCFQDLITSVDELSNLIGTPSELVIKKQLSELDDHMRTFIAESPFLLLGTVDREGRCDVSPRGDVPSVASVIDSQTLVLAERPGNRRADSLQNIMETGRVGLLFMIPGQGETLRVNGRACVFRDNAVLETMTVNDKQPVVGIGVEIEECYLQCAKALIRSHLWDNPENRKQTSLPSYGQILIDQTKIDQTVESLNQQIEESYAKRLY